MEASFYQQLCKEETELEKEVEKLTETLDSVRTLKNHYKARTSPVINNDAPITIVKGVIASGLIKGKSKPTEFPLSYDRGLTQFQKTYLAVHLLGEGFATDIAKKLSILDPEEFNPEKAYKVAKEKASDLYGSGIFGVRRYGRKYKYFIK